MLFYKSIKVFTLLTEWLGFSSWSFTRCYPKTALKQHPALRTFFYIVKSSGVPVAGILTETPRNIAKLFTNISLFYISYHTAYHLDR